MALEGKFHNSVAESFPVKGLTSEAGAPDAPWRSRREFPPPFATGFPEPPGTGWV